MTKPGLVFGLVIEVDVPCEEVKADNIATDQSCLREIRLSFLQFHIPHSDISRISLRFQHYPLESCPGRKGMEQS